MTPRGRGILVGCGNIGALYDFDGAGITTHAKAYRALNIPFDVVDIDAARAAQVTARFGGRSFPSLAGVDLIDYRVASVCSSTNAHAVHLKPLLAANVPLILCEKPVALVTSQLRELTALRAESTSIVLVNYMRRFLPAYRQLRIRIGAASARGALLSAVVKYQRGFMTNGSHALDLIEYLLGETVSFDSFIVSKVTADAFPYDPTVTGTCEIGPNRAAVVLVGVPGASYTVFEIELNFADKRVLIRDRGNTIAIFEGTAGAEAGLRESDTIDDCLKDYMLPVFEEGNRLLAGGTASADNFDAAVHLNLRMANALDRIRR